MEFTIKKPNTTFHITVEGTESYVDVLITKVQHNGGKPQTINKKLDIEVPFDKAMGTINMVVNLDDEMYSMISQAQSEG